MEDVEGLASQNTERGRVNTDHVTITLVGLISSLAGEDRDRLRLRGPTGLRRSLTSLWLRFELSFCYIQLLRNSGVMEA